MNHYEAAKDKQKIKEFNKKTKEIEKKREKVIDLKEFMKAAKDEKEVDGR